MLPAKQYSKRMLSMVKCRYGIKYKGLVKPTVDRLISSMSSKMMATMSAMETKGFLVSALGDTSFTYGGGWSLFVTLEAKYLQEMFQVHQTPKEMNTTPFNM